MASPPVEEPTPPSIARSFIGLGVGEAAARLIAFATTLVIARRLGAEGLGVVSFAFAILLYLQRIVDAGFDLGIGIREAATRRQNLRDFVPPVLTFRFALAAATIGVVVFSALVIEQVEGDMVVLYALTLIPLALSTRWVVTGMGMSGIAGLSRAVGEAIVLIVVFLVVSNETDLWRVPVSQLLGDTAAALLLLTALHQYGVHASLRWDGGTVRPLVRHVAPYVGSALLGLAIFNSDLLFLRAFADRATVGLYAAAYALVSFLINVGATYSLSLIPPLAQLAKDPVARQSVYGTAWARALAVMVPVAVGGGLIAHGAITVFFGPAFAAAGTVLVVLLISVPLSVLRSIAASALMAQGREDILLRTVLIAAVVNIALNLIAVPAFGMLGAATVTVLTELLRLVLAQRYAATLGVRAPGVQRHWKTALATVIMATSVALGFRQSFVAAITVGVLVYAVALFAVRGIGRGEGGRVELLV
jgi:O-antigen/teichoic acid export membrane protein